ncbi:MAG TPA: hypothetical protein VGO00_07670 [Kofleriaceae bacterium]|nr:hypothetical protein [Kofleriaceae bacterium]
MTDTPTVVVGRAYQRRATLELAGEMLTWRAQRGDLELIAENIVTTVRDVRAVRWIVQRWSTAGLVLAGLSVLWMFSESPTFGVCVLAIASAVIALRLTRPRRWLVVELDGHRLALRVSPDAAGGARELASRIEQMRLTEPGAKPLPLP